MRIEKSIISGNRAFPAGAGIFLWDSTATIINSEITYNIAEGTCSRGGGICYDKSRVFICGCTMVGNEARGSSCSSGGAISSGYYGFTMMEDHL